MNNDLLLGLPNARNEFNNFLVTGIASSITSNRISFHYDLLGPSLTVDTACSSALVSVHLGCQAIQTGNTYFSKQKHFPQQIIKLPGFVLIVRQFDSVYKTIPIASDIQLNM